MAFHLNKHMIHKIITYIKRGLIYIWSGIPVQHVTANISVLAPNRQLIGKKVLVTGGSRGLGKAMAEKFISEGAEVVITGRNESVLKQVSDEIGSKYIAGDIMDEKFLCHLVDQAVTSLGGLNVLVNNAGVSLHEWEIEKVTLEGWDKQFDTNLRAPYFLTQSFISYIKKHSIQGNILFVSSERSQTADIIPYGLTKAAMNSLVQGLAKKYSNQGIRINAVAPGVTASDMTGFDKDSNLYCPYNQTGRAYIPEEVAEVAAFLISDCSNCLAGQILVCNEAKTINAYF